MNKEKVDFFLENKCHNIQITLDGISVEHNKTRRHIQGLDTFNVILDNIRYALEQNLNINIRVNLKGNEEKKYIDLYNFLLKEFGKNSFLFITPAIIDDVTKRCTHSYMEEAKLLLALNKKYNLYQPFFYPGNFRSECSIRSPYDLIIGPQGELYKCYNDIGNPQKEFGNLCEDKIPDKQFYYDYLYKNDQLEDLVCLKCFYFPICSGGCTYKRIYGSEDQKRFRDCIFYKNNIESFLKIHYDKLNESHDQ